LPDIALVRLKFILGIFEGSVAREEEFKVGMTKLKFCGLESKRIVNFAI